MRTQEIKKEIDEAIEKAKAAPMPDAGELWTNIYVGEPAAKQRDACVHQPAQCSQCPQLGLHGTHGGQLRFQRG